MSATASHSTVRPAEPGLLRRLRLALFGDGTSAIVSTVLLAGLAWAFWQVLRWGVVDAVAIPDGQACREASGACWGALIEKHRLILLGRYPADERWRPWVGCLVLLVSLGVAAHPRFFGRSGLIMLTAGLSAFGLLMAGGSFGLTPVGSDLWGGLPLTLFLAVASCLLSVPLALALALARRSKLPAVSALATAYIEGLRGLPLITLLFFGAFVLPILLPAQWRLDPMLRIGICLTLFGAAYLAEVFRGGLQAIPPGQLEAAHALGLSRWQTLRHIVLPQALRITIAPTANHFIGALKDTSLVAVVNIYDLTGALKLAVADANWAPYFVEMYVAVCAIYLAAGLAIAGYGRFLEARYRHQ